MKDEIIQKIREIGVPEQNVEELYNVISGEALDVIFKELTEKSTDDELTIIENRIKESKSTEHFETILNEIAITLYGDNALTEIKNIYLDLLDSFKQNIDEAKQLIERAKNGDQEALLLLQKAKNSDIFQSTINQQ